MDEADYQRESKRRKYEQLQIPARLSKMYNCELNTESSVLNRLDMKNVNVFNAKTTV